MNRLEFCRLMSTPFLLNATMKAMAQGQPDLQHAPRMVLIIRHAEKPPKEAHSPDLNPRGFQRAAALPALFVQQPGKPAPRLPRPDAVFATARTVSSNRPVETVTPLAQALGLTLNKEFEESGEALTEEILSGRYAGKVVLVCWHHGRIPFVARRLGATNAPAEWDAEVFNQVWKIEYRAGRAVFSTCSEGVLPGDPA